MKTAIVLFLIGIAAGVMGIFLFTPMLSSGDGSGFESEPGTGVTASSTALSSVQSAAVPRSPAVADTEAALRVAVELDATAALLDASGLSEPMERRRAVMSIGRIWAGIDPEAALEAASLLQPELRRDFNAAVATQWANLDAAAFFVFAERSADLDALIGGLNLLIATDPVRVHSIADRLPGVTEFSVGTQMHDIQREALHAIADRDPAQAMQMIEPWITRIDRSPVPQEVISRIARSDPEAALAWLNAFEGATNTHWRVVLEGVAEVDFARAFDYAASMQNLYLDIDYALAGAALSDTTQTAELAGMLLQRDSALAHRVLDGFLGSWAFREPEKSFEWMLANAGSMDSSLARDMAAGYAGADLEAAMQLLERVPPQFSGVWVSEVTAQYAEQDPAAALDWIQQYQGQAIHEELYSLVVMTSVRSNPDFAASTIDQLSPALRSIAAPAVAQALLQRDPASAADWASGLADSEAAVDAVYEVTRSWVRSDTSAATNWAMVQERGAIRDRALHGLVSGSSGINLDPRQLIDEIDSDYTRKLAQQSAMGNNVLTRPALARELAAELVNDPRFADHARNVLERTGGLED